MKRKIVFLVCLILSFVMTNAQRKMDKNATAVNESAEKLRLAMISSDRIALESLIVPELTYGHSGGHIDDAKEFVEKLVSKKSNFLTIDITNQTVTVVGKTATVRHHLYATTNDLGKQPGEVNLDVLLVWIKTKDGWKLLARQAVKTDKK